VCVPNVIGLVLFAECPKHSAKPILHSAKALPSATVDKFYTAIIVTAKKALLSVFSQALGKAFATCHKALGRVREPAKDFAECYTKALDKSNEGQIKKTLAASAATGIGRGAEGAAPGEGGEGPVGRR